MGLYGAKDIELRFAGYVEGLVSVSGRGPSGSIARLLHGPGDAL